ncbi:MAG: pimeloyl-ACP methyl ester carboxylesterase [Candidatus Azotimanducaceae bacterium]|jgi:pimeloyl-ACP methyl ester carboxylesterase
MPNPSLSFLDSRHGQVSVLDNKSSGPPILFMHGNSSCKEIFSKQFDSQIGKNYRCIAFDLPGHGMSRDADLAKDSYKVSSYAELAMELISDLGIDSIAVVGWSLGGHIGLELMGRSDRVKALLISGTPPIALVDVGAAFLASESAELTSLEEYTEAEAIKYTEATCGAAYDDFMLDAVRRTDGRSRSLMVKALISGDGINQRDEVECNSTPLAIVNGDLDPFLNPSFFNSVNFKNLWKGQVHEIPGAGHAPFYTHHLAFNLLLDQFLNENVLGNRNI